LLVFEDCGFQGSFPFVAGAMLLRYAEAGVKGGTPPTFLPASDVDVLETSLDAEGGDMVSRYDDVDAVEGTVSFAFFSGVVSLKLSFGADDGDGILLRSEERAEADGVASPTLLSVCFG
jgi:hypothetical protein